MTIGSLQTVGEIAAQSLSALRVLESHGIDYCCGGQRSLQEVCHERGIDAAAVMRELDAAQALAEADNRDWRTAPLAELARHIVATHHAYLKDELPRLTARLDAVRKAHAARHGAVLEPLGQIFTALREEMEMHMQKEEMVLFPFMGKLDQAVARGVAAPVPPFGSVENPIRIMEHEHEDAGRALAEMRQLTAGFTPPEDACNTFRALYTGLQELERDLHLHVHLENNILFPRAVAIEKSEPTR